LYSDFNGCSQTTRSYYAVNVKNTQQDNSAAASTEQRATHFYIHAGLHGNPNVAGGNVARKLVNSDAEKKKKQLQSAANTTYIPNQRTTLREQVPAESPRRRCKCHDRVWKKGSKQTFLRFLLLIPCSVQWPFIL